MNIAQDGFVLYNSATIPCLGFGTWQIPDGTAAVGAVKEALRKGYRHIDAAAIYGNETSVGKGIVQSGVDREELFVTSKVWNSERGYEKTLAAFDKTLDDLQLEYLDLFLIHWPASPSQFKNWQTINLTTWEAMEELYNSGRVRTIGVCNFMVHHLEPLLQSDVRPMVNQIEYHPGQQQEETVEFCKRNNILIEAWSPLGSGINHHLPEVETITMYGSIANIASKSDEELKALRSLNINDLNIGLESGLSSVLKDLHKGFTIEQAKIQIERLKAASFDFSLNIIIGAAGSTLWEANALTSAKIVNELQPHLIFVAALHLEEYCELAMRLQQGSFQENTLRENIDEEIMFLENLELNRTRFFAVHPSNAIPVDGYLPQDKRKISRILEEGRDTIDTKWLNTRNTSLVKGGEGAILLDSKR